MFKIDSDKTIHLTRGDEAKIKFTIDDYTFQVNDKVSFVVMEKKNVDEIKLKKDITVSEVTDNVIIELDSSDTKIDDLIDKPVTYWYEISLNDSSTVVGYDEDGAKELILYPESGDSK